MSPLIVALSCWGPHVDIFRRVGFPSLLAEGNLDWLKRFGPVHLLVFTPERDEAEIRSIIEPHGKGFASARAFLFSDDWLGKYPNHVVMCALQRQALERARGIGAGLSWLYPDCIYAEGAFASLGDLDEARKNGIGAFASQGMPILGDSTLYIDGALPRVVPGSAALLPKEPLIEALHGAAVGSVVKGFGLPPGPTTRSPWLTYWESDPGYVLHTFAPNPIICWPRKQIRPWVAALDGDFFDAFEMDGTVEPAHAFAWLEARVNTYDEPFSVPPMTEEEIAKWAAEEATPFGLKFFREQLRPWHSATSLDALGFSRRVSEMALNFRSELGWREDNAAYAPKVRAA